MYLIYDKHGKSYSLTSMPREISAPFLSIMFYHWIELSYKISYHQREAHTEKLYKKLKILESIVGLALWSAESGLQDSQGCCHSTSAEPLRPID